MLNPEPLAPFFDLFLIGEAEVMLPSFLANYRRTDERPALLDRVSREVPGAYVLDHFQPDYQQNGPLRAFTALGDQSPRIRSPKVADVGTLATATTVLTTDTTFPETCLIEVSRGCPHGCRFCSAGYIYRPPRYRHPDFLETCIRNASRTVRRVGMVGAAVSDFPAIGELCGRVADTGVRLSFSSLRADALTDDLLAVLRANRTKTATIAPEAGSPRLRNVINKGLGEEDILAAAAKLVSAGIPNLKLYFLIGLPTETDADVEAIVTLCERIKAVFLAASRKMKRIGTITVNATPFVPKPATPFQWAGMAPPRVLKARLRILRKGLQRIANVRFQNESIREAYVQALLARGDRRVAEILSLHHRLGGRWPQTLKTTPVDTDFFALRERAADELLPWDFIDTGVHRDFLWREYQRALAASPSKPCPGDRPCERCGACNQPD
ncbi:MAG: radical SAM protein [Desulfosarcina sp.]|nr:radical SAM protein [Desulfobacterales bacterium]